MLFAEYSVIVSESQNAARSVGKHFRKQNEAAPSSEARTKMRKTFPLIEVA